ncbi:hypothetical protein ACFV0L_32740 [Streptosporangium canum]|uniref:hypothetical protein n=1 Tax=Streptosporangium canum TaxID=324952 RepID=UPI00368C5BCF
MDIASLAAFAPSRALRAYSTSKAAVKMLSDCLRAVHRNRPVVAVNAEGKIGYALSRISPAVMRRLARLSGAAEISRLPNSD